MVSAGPLLTAVSARVYAACGWLSFRIGLRRQAQKHYERVLRLKGDDFSAYVHLGRIAYDAGDYAGWRREFEHARRADPVRFAHLRHPFELFEPRLAGTTFGATGERATWQSLRSSGAAQRVGGQHPKEMAGNGNDTENVPAAFDVPAPRLPRNDRELPLFAIDQDDCRSKQERRRLRDLGPIDRNEVAACDLDELAARLTNGNSR